jgi:hypothetical protein
MSALMRIYTAMPTEQKIICLYKYTEQGYIRIILKFCALVMNKDNVNMDNDLERPWIVLTTTYDVEAWIDNYNRDLQRLIENRNTASGYGICFRLTEGGEVYLHTTPEGEILLDVTQEAQWMTPVIVAATGAAIPVSQIWTLPGDTLTQLILGMSTLIGFTRLVTAHDFKIKKYYY